MKISKLFHWLYAILMLLPAFAIGVTCAYAIFNKNAYHSYYGETINEVSNKDLTSNNEINNDIDYYYDSTRIIDTQISGSLYYTICEYVNSSSLLTNEQITHINSSVRFYYYRGTSTTFYLSDNTSLVVVGTIEVIISDINKVASSANAYRSLYYKSYNYDSYIDNVFYYSIDKVEESPLFNWAYDSFLSTPITYITGLFGIANDHISVMLMSYWLAISVIWLVFDMVMYVPLLVHRWIDKGVLE